jgi:hypothetical protein
LGVKLREKPATASLPRNRRALGKIPSTFIDLWLYLAWNWFGAVDIAVLI